MLGERTLTDTTCPLDEKSCFCSTRLFPLKEKLVSFSPQYLRHLNHLRLHEIKHLVIQILHEIKHLGVLISHEIKV